VWFSLQTRLTWRDGNISKATDISTSGLSSKIVKLGKLNLGINLAISLHAVDDELREQLMPINRAYNIKSIIDAVKSFPINQRKRVMFEYLVIKGVNDDLKSGLKNWFFPSLRWEFKPRLNSLFLLSIPIIGKLREFPTAQMEGGILDFTFPGRLFLILPRGLLLAHFRGSSQRVGYYSGLGLWDQLGRIRKEKRFGRRFGTWR